MKKLILVAAALLVAMFALTACGGDESDGGGSGANSQADQELRQKFETCMKEHGVELPGVPAGGKDSGQEVAPISGSSAEIEAARAACAKYAPSQDANEDITEADQDRALKKAECLRKQGINAKDPEPGTIEITVEETGTTREKLVAAFSTCNKQFPGPSGPASAN
ncbi:hypothetical protein [Actinomadura algeriensis]|uniref:DUF732 domain-containing protein n=1 Tax=Actinomadura algeriensis TaxID=1679523 RepID=A0ABR9JJC2_9ACTN|nr:hypothetical protein [Actinomadura algeriensis]MBE1530647.1 hypothetical protein [Actinomadura algeriensis]